MQSKDIMTTSPETVIPDATLQQASEKMKRARVGALPVVRNEKLVGILTDRDIVVRAIAEGRSPEQTQVEDVMSKDVVTCYEDQPISEAAELMAGKQIRRLCVVTRDEKPVGIVSLKDLATATDNSKLVGTVLKDISEDRG